MWMHHSQNDNGDGCARGVWVDGDSGKSVGELTFFLWFSLACLPSSCLLVFASVFLSPPFFAFLLFVQVLSCTESI